MSRQARALAIRKLRRAGQKAGCRAEALTPPAPRRLVI